MVARQSKLFFVFEPDARMGEDKDTEKRPKREGAWSSLPAAKSLNKGAGELMPVPKSPRPSRSPK